MHICFIIKLPLVTFGKGKVETRKERQREEVRLSRSPRQLRNSVPLLYPFIYRGPSLEAHLVIQCTLMLINRPGVAGAVLQSPSLLIN